MPKLLWFDGDAPQPPAYHPPYRQRQPRKRYGFFNFMFDCILVALTSGLWLIWIFVREMRK